MSAGTSAGLQAGRRLKVACAGLIPLEEPDLNETKKAELAGCSPPKCDNARVRRVPRAAESGKNKTPILQLSNKRTNFDVKFQLLMSLRLFSSLLCS